MPINSPTPLQNHHRGKYVIILSTNERAAEVIDAFKLAGADKRFTGVIDAISKARHRASWIPRG